MDRYRHLSHSAKPTFRGIGEKWWIWLSVAALLYIPIGCSSVSDEEMTKLREETYALEAELAAAKQEAAILDRVLTNVYKERDNLVDQINRATAESQGLPPPAPASEPGQPSPEPQSRLYLAQSGDTLSSIAQKHQTTVQVLLELNPHISRRGNQMVWVNDEVILPSR
ncbi:MAG: LysM peptidoglycan-binding domain-containing protein [Deltaproteobacteria bacterium]|jgi:LysM repeat protein|nr:LysM peptidoglycan-binding domain-containing protein [Deltaproteobacteria bacterium]